MGSYLGGLFSSVQDGRTPQVSLKLKPKKNGIEYLGFHVMLENGPCHLNGAFGDGREFPLPVDCGTVVYAMDGRLEAIVGQAHQIVTDIDDECALDGTGLDPLTFRIQHLKTAAHVLPQQGEALEIGV